MPYQPFAYGGCQSRVLDHEILAVILQEVLLARGVKLLLHTRFVDVIERDGRLAEAIVAGPSGPEALSARHFVDCTGDGLVAKAAGYAVEKGRAGDGLQLPMSLMFLRARDGEPVSDQLPDGWFARSAHARTCP